VSVGLLFCYTAETKGLKWVYPKGVSFGFDTGKYLFFLSRFEATAHSLGLSRHQFEGTE
jgi:hypothetical protein